MGHFYQPDRPILTFESRSPSSPTASITPPIPPHSSHTSSLETSHSSTNFAIALVKPRSAQGSAIVVLPRIETHVYLNIGLPSRSWNAIHLPFSKSLTSDDSSGIGEGSKPLLLASSSAAPQHGRSATVYASNARRGWEIRQALRA